MHVSKQILAIGAGAIVTTSLAQASVMYSSQSSFISALNAGYFAQNFQSYADGSGHATPMSASGGAGNAFSYSLTTTAQAFLVFSLSSNRYLTTSGQPTTAWSAPVTISFTGAPVNAIGGSFFLTNAFGNVVNSTVSLSFSDGTSVNLTSQSNSTFFGYVSNTTITSLTFSPPATHHFVSIDNLTVGWSQVPTPGTAMCLVLGSAALARRRRR